MSDSDREELLYAAKDTRKRGQLEGATIIERKANPSCGDVVTVYARIEEEKVVKLSFEGQGCVISMAGASTMAETLEGRFISEILALSKADVLKCLGVPVGPMRENCLMLFTDALKRGITVWQDSK
jgi:nitrogen fixation NifU-like protein